MKIYTKTGDKGLTSLFGGQRVYKSHSRIDAYGTVDELNSVLGMARTAQPDQTIETLLERLQNELFVLGADLATPAGGKRKIQRIGQSHIQQLEQDIDTLETSLPALRTFILPGGTPCAATLHLARTVCRRAERSCFICGQSEIISSEALVYLNRLSDLLFVMARFQNHASNVEDTPWNTSASEDQS